MTKAEVPYELINALNAMGNERRFTLLLTLMERGELTYSQILQGFRFSQNIVAHHLQVLVRAGLIENYYLDAKHSIYCISPLGEELLNNFFAALKLVSFSHEELTQDIEGMGALGIGRKNHAKTTVVTDQLQEKPEFVYETETSYGLGRKGIFKRHVKKSTHPITDISEKKRTHIRLGSKSGVFEADSEAEEAKEFGEEKHGN